MPMQEDVSSKEEKDKTLYNTYNKENILNPTKLPYKN